MCNGFSGLWFRDGTFKWSLPDENGDISHSDIIMELGCGKLDNRYHTAFVRFEFTRWTETSFKWDEPYDQMPAWLVGDEAQEILTKLMLRVEPIVKEYMAEIKILRDKFETWTKTQRPWLPTSITDEKRYDSKFNTLNKRISNIEKKYDRKFSKFPGYVTECYQTSF